MATVRILCAHESTLVRRELRKSLEAAHYEVLLARSAEEALKVLEHVPVDGVVLGCHLEGSDGRSLRSMILHFDPNMPMLLFSDVDEIRDMPLHVFAECLQGVSAPAEVLSATGS